MKIPIYYYAKHLKIYLKESITIRKKHPSAVPFIELIQLFPKWLKYLNTNKIPIIDGIPWLTFKTIDFLDKHVNCKSLVFEYGSGGSTFFFADRAKKIISVEHDKIWFQAVEKYLKEKKVCNVEYYLIEPEDFRNPIPEKDLQNKSSDPKEYTSLSLINKNFQGKNFRKYAEFIENYDDDFFDFILIDGRARPSCLIHSIKKIKKGGFIIFDNIDQEHYLFSINSLLNSFKRTNCYGVTPYSPFFSYTSIWQRII
jgi:hypothetical protein